ncbi:MAG: gliding motility-associated C-terminal domain-containing protein [Bacteroidetes bacterium]|nr:gliding motility-associated C-terminal domain-containing protein [Bacteroidota bacterium]
MKILFRFIAVWIVITAFAATSQLYAQTTYNIATNNGYTYTVCSGILYDSGGNSGGYQANEDYSITFCSANVGEQIFITFTMDTESGYDYVYVYDGPSVSSTLINSYAGTSGFTVSSTNGCLTIRFDSDGSVQNSGFAGTISCGTPPPPPPPPPANCSDCFGAIPVCTNYYNENDITSGEADISELSSSNHGCLSSNENNTRWYIFTVGQSGSFTFTIDSPYDYDWAMWNMTGHSCNDIINGSLPMLRCNYSADYGETGLNLSATGTSEGAGGPPWCRYINAQAGETYVLLVDKYTSGTASYDLDFATGGGTAGGIYDITPPTIVAIDSPYVCGVSTINVTFSENISCASHEPSDWLVVGPDGVHAVASISSSGCTGGAAYDVYYGINFVPPLTQTGVYELRMVGDVQDICGNSLGSGSYFFNIVGLSTSFSNVTPATCGMSDGTATMTATGGTGNFTYTWNTIPPQYTATAVNMPPGLYSVTVSDAGGGCTVVDTVTIAGAITLPPVGASAASNVVCPGGSTVLTATGAVTYAWSPGTGLSSVSGSPVTATPPVTTTYTVTGTDYGCTNTATITITILPEPIITISPPSLSLCPNEAQVITASGASTFTWSPATYLSATSGASVTVTPQSNMVYYVNGIDSHGCSNTASISITLNPPASVSTYPAGPYICLGNTVSIDAMGLASYTWSPSTGLNLISGPSVIASPSVTTTYTVSGTDASGCPGSTTVTVSIYAAPIINITPDSSSVCYGNPISLTAVGGNSYTWSPAAGLSVTTGPTVVATPYTPVNYTVSSTDFNGCTGSADAYINIYPDPVVEFTGDPIDGCEPHTVAFTDQTNVPVAFYAWDFGDYYSNLNTSADSAPTHEYLHSGEFDVTLKVTSNYGCKSQLTKSHYIKVYELPEIDFYFTPRYPEVINSTVFFHPEGLNYDIAEWIWNFGDPSSENEDWASIATPAHTYRDSGTYIVTLVVANSYSCADTVQKTVFVNDVFNVYVPSAFTPNGDELNDKVCVKGSSLDPEDFRFYIFDRWGSILYFSEDLEACWDGTDLKGNPIAQGTYIWMVRIKEMRGIPRKFTGHITILR